MSEHSWVIENIAVYVTGGLEAAECERLEQHTAACEPCARALAEARGVDQTLEALFAGVRPEAGLEDRLIRSLRAAPQRRQLRIPFYGKIAIGAAAAVLLGILGAGVNGMMEQGTLPFPGSNLSEFAFVVKKSPVLLHEERNRGVKVVDDSNSLKSTEELARETREKAFAESQERDGVEAFSRRRLRFSTANDEIGNDPNLPTNYNLNRIEDASVPGTDGTAITSTPFGRASTGHANDRLSIMGTVIDDFSRTQNGSMATRGHSSSQGWGLRKSGGLPADELGWKGKEAVPANKPALSALKDGEQNKPPSSGEKGVELLTEETRQQKREDHYSYRDDRPADSTKQLVPGAMPATPPSSSTPSKPVFLGIQLEIASGERRPASQNYFKPSEFVAGLTVKSQTESRPAGAPKGAEVAAAARPEDKLPSPSEGQKPGQGAIGDFLSVRRLAESEKPKGESPAKKPAPAPDAEPAGLRKIIIRSGDIEFEIDSFDSAVATVTKLVNDIKGGFVATVNSEKLPNGKVRGSVVVRVPPERLDPFILDLRKELGKVGELKSQRIGSQDITKQYTDLESRLRAARTMEERLLAIIKSGKGEIKDLILAEKELGVWRTRIEEYEGELRYYGNLVALSTLTISLYEKEIRSPFGVVETERIQMGLEVEEVEKAQQETLRAVAEAKGRVTKSELKQHAAGQYNAVIHFEVAPDAAGLVRDRLRQIGTVARLEIDRLQQTEGGSGKPQEIKTKRNDTQFLISIYNLANVAPRETIHLNLAAVDAEAAYKAILARVEKAAGRVVTSSLNRQRSEQTTGTIQFEIKTAQADAVLLELKDQGEVMRLQVTENPDTQNVTKSKKGFNVQLFALATVTPRETTVVQLASRDVPAGYDSLHKAVAKAKGRMLNAQLNEQDKQNITANLDFEVRREEEVTIQTALAAIGDIFSRNVTRAQDNENVVDSKVRVQVALINQARIPPRETVTLGIEVAEVEKTAAALAALISESKGRVVQSPLLQERTGRITSKQVFDVPLATASGLVDKIKATGILRARQSSRNQQVPESELAIARLDVTLSNADPIIRGDEGFWSQIRAGFRTSFQAISWSLMLVIIGICVVLPWAAVIYVVYRIVMRMRRRAGAATPAV